MIEWGYTEGINRVGELEGNGKEEQTEDARWKEGKGYPPIIVIIVWGVCRRVCTCCVGVCSCRSYMLFNICTGWTIISGPLVFLYYVGVVSYDRSYVCNANMCCVSPGHTVWRGAPD